MVHPEGFEPPTPWFVAKYSIQMSYGHIKMVGRLGFEPRWYGLRVRCINRSANDPNDYVVWYDQQASNLRPQPSEGCALSI